MSEKQQGAERLWSLSPEYVQALADHGVVRAYPKNAVIINEGDVSDAMYVILAGRVKIYLADDEGKEVLLNTQGPGEYFGEIMLDEGPRSASVVTLEPSRFSIVSRAQFKAFLADTPEAAFELITALIHRVRDLTRNVGNLALRDVYGRVAGLLQELATEQDGKLVITPRPTQSDIASRVGCSREMISRIFKDLRKGGYIREESDAMVIAKKPPKNW